MVKILILIWKQIICLTSLFFVVDVFIMLKILILPLNWFSLETMKKYDGMKSGRALFYFRFVVHFHVFSSNSHVLSVAVAVDDNNDDGNTFKLQIQGNPLIHFIISVLSKSPSSFLMPMGTLNQRPNMLLVNFIRSDSYGILPFRPNDEALLSVHGRRRVNENIINISF